MARAILSLLAAVVAGLALWASVWIVPSPKHGPARSWSYGTKADCPLLQQGLDGAAPQLLARMRRYGFERLPVMIGDGDPPCDLGAHLPVDGVVTGSAFRAAWNDETGLRYTPHITLRRPSYSLLRMRAAVDVGVMFGGDVGYGYLCLFQRELRGWRLISCRRSWIS